jgi:6-phosphogluconate dehydrogenase (decarboxylating)
VRLQLADQVSASRSNRVVADKHITALLFLATEVAQSVKGLQKLRAFLDLIRKAWLIVPQIM